MLEIYGVLDISIADLFEGNITTISALCELRFCRNGEKAVSKNPLTHFFQWLNCLCLQSLYAFWYI
jgi:hypothetical protein